jgi:hypothetical protein
MAGAPTQPPVAHWDTATCSWRLLERCLFGRMGVTASNCCLLLAVFVLLQGQLGNKWAEVARHIPGRTGQQCAQRWRHTVRECVRTAQAAAAVWCLSWHSLLLLTAASLLLHHQAVVGCERQHTLGCSLAELHSRACSAVCRLDAAQVCSTVPCFCCAASLLQNPSISKGKWTPQEDELLAQLVDSCGVGRW